MASFSRHTARLVPVIEWAKRHSLRIVILLLLIVAGLFFLGTRVLPFFFIAFFLIISSFSLIYNRWIRTSIGIEFITLSVVLSGRVYGPWVAAFIGLVGLTAAEIIGTGFNPKTLISLGAIVGLSFIIPFLSDLPIFAAGMIFVIVYDAIIIPLYMFAGSNIARSGLFVITHIVFNAWVFWYIAPFIEKLMLV